MLERGRIRLLWTVALVFGAGILTAHGLGLAATPSPSPTATVAPTPTTAATTTAASPASPVTTSSLAPSGQLTVREINKRVRPAIIQITNNQKAGGAFSPGPTIPTGFGTGFIIDNRGYAITNNHVVGGAQSLTVATTDNKTYSARIVGTSPDSDIAVIQIMGGGDFPYVTMGDSSNLQVGDQVVAIGNALALDGGPTVTSGVVSAVGRTVQEPGDQRTGLPAAYLIDAVQTDAAINPGNSGGPLLDMNGEVVGVNTLGAGQAEPGVQTQGISFAIAINSAKVVANAIINNLPIARPYVGWSSAPLSPLQAAQLQLPTNSGAVVTGVEKGSPADKAGIQANDIILKIDGQDVRGEGGVPNILLRKKPGDAMSVILMRDGKQQTVTVTVTQAQQGQSTFGSAAQAQPGGIQPGQAPGAQFPAGASPYSPYGPGGPSGAIPVKP
jgi:S1-C subfamily serine protease